MWAAGSSIFSQLSSYEHAVGPKRHKQIAEDALQDVAMTTQALADNATKHTTS
jgi:hypothetical protein